MAAIFGFKGIYSGIGKNTSITVRSLQMAVLGRQLACFSSHKGILMKIQLKKMVQAFGLAGLSLTLLGCGSGTDDIAPVQVPDTPQSPAIDGKYRYEIVFVDALTGATVTDDLSVQVTGPSADSGEVLDGSSSPVKGKVLNVTGGLLGLQVKNFDGTDDVFSVVGGNLAKGWNTSGVQLLKDTSKEGSNSVVIKLTNRNDAAKVNAETKLGLSISTGTATATSGGVIATAVTLGTSPKNTTSTDGASVAVGTATITIPAGTKASDAVGNAASGPLALTVTKFSNEEPQSLSAFPGGFTVSAQTSAANNGTTAGTFVTGGFAQFNVTDASGKAIKKFDTPVTLKIDLPKTSKHPATDTALKVGDIYPVWSFDETTGKWVFEADGTITEKSPADANNWEVEFKSTHLSYWNLDYFSSANCTGGLTINRGTDTRPLDVQFIGVSGTSWQKTIYGVRDSVQTINNAPKIKVNAIVKSNGVAVGRINNVSLCDKPTVTVSLPQVTLVTLTVNVSESCPDGVTGKRPKPSFIYANMGGTWLTGSTLNSGDVSTIKFDRIEANTAATVYVYNATTGQYSSENLTVSAAGATVNKNFNNLTCRTLTGATGSSS